MAKTSPIHHNLSLSKPQNPSFSHNHRIRDKFLVRKKVCYFCSKSFINLSLLELHLRKHTGERPFKCQFCWKSFLYSPTLRYHRKRHIQAIPRGRGEVQFQSKCPLCLKKVLPQNFEKHVEIHSGKQTWSCYFCITKTFTSWTGLKYHLRTHTGEKPFRCEACDTSFGDTSTYRRHKTKAKGKLCRGPLLVDHDRDHNQPPTHQKRRVGITGHAWQGRWRCFFCTKTFTSWSGFEIHSRIHTREQPFRCEICETSFRDPYSYRCHAVKGYNSKAKLTQLQLQPALSLKNFPPFQKLTQTCYFCFKTFMNRTALEIHIRIHTEENPFKCHICLKSFRYLSIFQSHYMENHAKRSSTELLSIGTKTQFKGECPLCLKKVSSWNLDNHVKNHSRESYCYFCCKPFARRYLLDDHLRVHTREKPFRCGICGKCYHEPCGYRYHIKTHKRGK